jgi:MFS transporter, FSR family, fosmidomycin resistance protein
MSQATDVKSLSGITDRLHDARVIGLVGGAHLVSHVHLIVLPPLFLFIRNDYGLSYAQLGVVLAVFNVVSIAFQAPAGFLVDRLPPRRLLIAALFMGASGLAFAAVVPFYWALIAGWALAGAANTIYHPADYAILSEGVRERRIGQAFSMHAFFGMLGTAVTPAAMLFLADFWGWRGAILGAAALGLVMALVVVQQRSVLGGAGISTRHAKVKKAGWDLLLSAPILRNVIFFILLSAGGSGIYGFSIVALGALYGTTLPVANFALTSYLMTSALGVLIGGFVAQRTERHDRVAFVGLLASGMAILFVALVPLAGPVLVLMFAIAGLFGGLILPSRDMLVRAITPPGSFGRVFGFVSTGFSIGAVFTPLLYGWLMDQNQPRTLFLLVVAFTLLTLPFVMGAPKPAAASPG